MTRRDQYGHLLFSSKTQRPSTETTLVSIFAIQRQSSLITCRDKYGHLPPLLKTWCLSTATIVVSLYHPQTNMVICLLLSKTQCLLSETIAVSLCYPKTIESDSTRRHLMVIPAFVIQRCQVRWHTETPHGYPHLCHLETASPVTHEDTSWLSAPLPSRDKRVRWHAETKLVICFLCRRP